MKLKNGKTIAKSLEPTFENVTREFITRTLYKILFSNEIPNFRFDFREEEAISFIEETLQSFRNEIYSESYRKEVEKEHKKILDILRRKYIGNTRTPIMVIKDYKKFFELLRQIYDKDIELFFKRTNMSGFHVYEKDNLFEQIWLRCTPEDFNDPEKFLEKQAQMITDTTFDKYDKEICLGKLSFLDNNILCIKNEISRTWDENSREFQISIYDKRQYDNTELFYRSHYTLPVIRYGIYNKNGRKVCYIGSIQNKNNQFSDSKEDIDKKVNRTKYKVNSGVPEELKDKVEPKSILALSIFINILHEEGITDIEVPCMYVLDYEYHEKRIKKAIEEFKKWTEKRKKSMLSVYNEEADFYGKEELISEIKSERMIKRFERILYHYPNGTINSYPTDVDSYFRLTIPVVKSENEIKGSILLELYKLVQSRNQENEK